MRLIADPVEALTCARNRADFTCSDNARRFGSVTIPRNPKPVCVQIGLTFFGIAALIDQTMHRIGNDVR